MPEHAVSRKVCGGNSRRLILTHFVTLVSACHSFDAVINIVITYHCTHYVH